MRGDGLVAWMVRLASVVAALALIVMMMTTVADVFMANVFKRPIIGAYDMVETTLVFAVFLGIPATFLRDGNIVVDVVDFFVSERTVRRLKRLALLLTLLFLVLLFWNMITPALDAYRFGDRKQELGLPLWVLWLPLLSGVLLSALAVLMSIIGGSRGDDRAGG